MTQSKDQSPKPRTLIEHVKRIFMWVNIAVLFTISFAILWSVVIWIFVPLLLVLICCAIFGLILIVLNVSDGDGDQSSGKSPTVPKSPTPPKPKR